MPLLLVEANKSTRYILRIIKRKLNIKVIKVNIFNEKHRKHIKGTLQTKH